MLAAKKREDAWIQDCRQDLCSFGQQGICINANGADCVTSDIYASSSGWSHSNPLKKSLSISVCGYITSTHHFTPKKIIQFSSACVGSHRADVNSQPNQLRMRRRRPFNTATELRPNVTAALDACMHACILDDFFSELQ